MSSLPDFFILAKFSHYEWSSFWGADQLVAQASGLCFPLLPLFLLTLFSGEQASCLFLPRLAACAPDCG
jgi:hypothetical protein